MPIRCRVLRFRTNFLRFTFPVFLAVAAARGALGQSQSASTPVPASTAAPARADTAGSKLIVPKDTAVPLELRNAINSRTAYIGQAIYCETIYPITVGNRIVIPVGSYVKGAVTQVVRPGRVKGRAQIGLRFDSLTLPNGTTHRLRATLSGFAGNGKEGFRRDESKVEGESSKGQDATVIASSAGEGAIIGAISHGGKGAGIGGAACGNADACTGRSHRGAACRTAPWQNARGPVRRRGPAATSSWFAPASGLRKSRSGGICRS